MASALGWMLTRRRYISTLPSLERKPRILIDWTLDFVFNHDTAGLLDYDFHLNSGPASRSLPDSQGTVVALTPDRFEAVTQKDQLHSKAA